MWGLIVILKDILIQCNMNIDPKHSWVFSMVRREFEGLSDIPAPAFLFYSYLEPHTIFSPNFERHRYSPKCRGNNSRLKKLFYFKQEGFKKQTTFAIISFAAKKKRIALDNTVVRNPCIKQAVSLCQRAFNSYF